MPKTNAEYCRDYREKRRENKIKKTAKSSTERVREFRARRKRNALIALLNLKNDSSITHNDDFTVQSSKGVQLKKIARNSTQRNQTDQTNALPNVPLTAALSTSTASNTGPAEIHPRLAVAGQERVVRDVKRVEHVANNSMVCQYHDYERFSTIHDAFKTKFGAVCSVCDCLWHENNMKSLPLSAKELFSAKFPGVNFETASICATCHLAVIKNKIPTLSKPNGVTYLSKPPPSPELVLISECLILPRLQHENEYLQRTKLKSIPQVSTSDVKTEPDETTGITHVKTESHEETDVIYVKTEPDEETVGTGEEKLLEYYSELYPDHEIKEELVIGPEILQAVLRTGHDADVCVVTESAHEEHASVPTIVNSFVCNHCNQVFTTKRCLEDHSQKHEQNNSKNYNIDKYVLEVYSNG